MSELDEKLDKFIKAVDLRLGEIERWLQEQSRADERISEDFNLPPNLSHVGTGIPPQPGPVRSMSQPETQGEFQTLKDSLSKVKLPTDVKLNDSRQGIKRTDQPLMNALAKCGRYCETGIEKSTPRDHRLSSLGSWANISGLIPRLCKWKKSILLLFYCPKENLVENNLRIMFIQGKT